MQGAPINGGVQKAAPESLWARLLYFSHYPTLAGNLGEKAYVRQDEKGVLPAAQGK